MPYLSNTANPHHTTGDPSLSGAKDNTWSTEIDGPHRDSLDNDDARTERGGRQEEDEYALLNSTETDEGRHPGRPLSWGENRYEAEADPVPPYAGYNDTASALSPGGYEEYRSQTKPAAGDGPYASQGYGAGGRGYSFGGGDRV